jgi:hypothetical protein
MTRDHRGDLVWQVVLIGFVFWIFGAVIPLLGLAGVSDVVAAYTSFEGSSAGHVTAAVLEPFVTKFSPALAVVALASRPRESFPGVVQRVLAVVYFPTIDLELVVGRPLVFGAYGGLSFGVLEAIGKVMRYDFGVTTGLVLAACLHDVTGLLVAGSVYWTVRMEREWIRGVIRGVGLALAPALHFAWNTGLNAIVIRAVSP